ncbi:ATP-binding cassette domain-containing protein [Mycoplasma procyoni]|uniref:ATP-binding cassette domain-containing protein n=1 Tax=Mycoplasma procyoni TaxID=568784 RepID=UPI00197C0777|nr:ABC transporter ATP-binding protein [Mycoplasma procyoni]MBN3534464.1 ABC transporter ATP-binding protein [Mycoplasma procyoni]
MNKLIKTDKSKIIIYFVIVSLVTSLPLWISFGEGYAINSILGTFSIANLNQFALFSIFVAIIALAHLSNLISNYFYYKMQNKMFLYIAKSTSLNVLEQLKKANHKSLISFSASDAYTQIIFNSSNLSQKLLFPIINIFSNFIYMIFLFSFFLSTTWVAFVIIFLIMSINILVNYLFYKKQAKANQKTQEAYESFFEKAIYLIDRFELFYFNNKENYFISQFQKETFELYNSIYKKENLESLSENSINSVVKVVELLGIIVLALLFFDKRFGVNLGLIYIFQKTINSSKDNFKALFGDFQTYLTSKFIIDKFDMKLQQDHATKELKEIETIEFQNVNLSFENKEILKDFSLKINKGEKVLITGESGKGKSSLMNLILKNVDEYTGKILLNATDIKEFSNNSIKQNISYLGSDNFLFDLNIKQNILLDSKEQKEKLQQILEMVSLDQELKDKLEITNLDASNSLSEGQKQRVALVRVLYNGSEVLLLDESLSNLNSELSSKILETLLETQKTIIYISHHLKTEQKQKFDKVIEL